ncbi:MAG: nuclear transport factor 2 family protein [Bacteroidota bacterium]
MPNVAQVASIQVVMLLAFYSISFSQQSGGEEAKQKIEQAVHRLFDGMRSGDSTAVHAVFSDQVAMYSAGNHKDGSTNLHEGSLEKFLHAVGTPHEIMWDERISNLSIQVDGPLATAWMNYSFYLGDTFSHCGVNSMTFLYKDGEWKIIYLIDTRRKDHCEG